jgi:hypothetical protein
MTLAPAAAGKNTNIVAAKMYSRILRETLFPEKEIGKGEQAMKTMRRDRVRPICSMALWGGLFFAFLFCPRAFAAEPEDFDFTYDILSMIQLNPDFSTYPSANGIIWLKQLDYGVGPHGGIQRKSQWILLGRKGLDPRWLLWNIPVPEGGESEILEASAYSSRSGEKIMSAQAITKEDGTMRSVAFSGLPDEFILVVSYRELFPEKLSIEDLIWLSEFLPVWESSIRVTVPAGHSFYYNSNADVVPKASNVDNRMVYKWQVVNTEADLPFSLRDEHRRYVAFSSRTGSEAAARSIKALETTPIPKLPVDVGKVDVGKVGRVYVEKSVEKPAKNPLETKTEAKAVENFLKWLYEQPELVLPDGALRKIPMEAPWTRHEKLLLAYERLKNAGLNVRLFWQLAYRPAAGEPVCTGMVVTPVLGIDLKKGTFYYTMEHPPCIGENSVSLWGQGVYGITPEGTLEERKISGSSASSNRLSAHFALTLDKEGVMSGTLRIVERNAWRRFLLPTQPTDEALTSFVKELFPRVPRYRDLEFKDSENEHEIRMTLTETQIIRSTQGHHFLVLLPSLVPSWFKSLTSAFPYTLRFPFIMEVYFRLTLPDSTVNVVLPTPTNRNAGRIKYTESYKLGKKKILTAEARISAGTTVIADEDAVQLNAALQSWQAFMVRHLPLQLRAK